MAVVKLSDGSVIPQKIYVLIKGNIQRLIKFNNLAFEELVKKCLFEKDGVEFPLTQDSKHLLQSFSLIDQEGIVFIDVKKIVQATFSQVFLK
jgi:hypothetical protein